MIGRKKSRGAKFFSALRAKLLPPPDQNPVYAPESLVTIDVFALYTNIPKTEDLQSMIFRDEKRGRVDKKLFYVVKLWGQNKWVVV